MIKCKVPYFCECGKDICCIYCEDKTKCHDRCTSVEDSLKGEFNALDECNKAYEEAEYKQLVQLVKNDLSEITSVLNRKGEKENGKRKKARRKK